MAIKTAPISKDRLKIGRFVIPYRVYGNGGPALVCLNGVQQSMAMWHSFIARFSRYYRIVVFDLPGQGQSRIEHGPANTSVDEQVEILRGVVDAAAVENITLCSASWGGVVALAFARKYPDSVRRLILAGMGTRPNKTMVETIEKGCRIDENQRERMASVLIESFGENLPETMKTRAAAQFQRARALRPLDEEPRRPRRFQRHHRRDRPPQRGERPHHRSGGRQVPRRPDPQLPPARRQERRPLSPPGRSRRPRYLRRGSPRRGKGLRFLTSL